MRVAKKNQQVHIKKLLMGPEETAKFLGVDSRRMFHMWTVVIVSMEITILGHLLTLPIEASTRNWIMI
jgi:hypothetical protein